MSDEAVRTNAEKKDLTLDQLIAFCEEIAALVRVGLPLEESLRGTSRKYHANIEEHLKRLVEKLGTGKSLAEAIREDPAFPPVYAAVIEAGIASNDLAGAMETISRNARTLRDTRVFLVRSGLYPVVLFSLLWILFSFVFFFLAPNYAAFYLDGRQSFFMLPLFEWVGTQQKEFVIFAVAVLLGVWLLFFLWLRRSKNAATIQDAGRLHVFGAIPWVSQATVQIQKMCFSRICSQLLRASLPLEDAIYYAARATHRRFGNRLDRDQLREAVIEKNSAKIPKSVFSPLIAWSLGIPNQRALQEGLDRYAHLSEVRAESLLLKSEIFLPVLSTVFFALVIGSCYVIGIFLPYFEVLNQLAHF